MLIISEDEMGLGGGRRMFLLGGRTSSRGLRSDVHGGVIIGCRMYMYESVPVLLGGRTVPVFYSPSLLCSLIPIHIHNISSYSYCTVHSTCMHIIQRNKSTKRMHT